MREKERGKRKMIRIKGEKKIYIYECVGENHGMDCMLAMFYVFCLLLNCIMPEIFLYIYINVVDMLIV